MLGKTQSDTLRHFDVPRRTLFEARNLTLVQCLGAERSNARVEAPFDQIVVHAVVCAQPKRSEAKQSERQEASSGERQGDRSIDRSSAFQNDALVSVPMMLEVGPLNIDTYVKESLSCMFSISRMNACC